MISFMDRLVPLIKENGCFTPNFMTNLILVCHGDL